MSGFWVGYLAGVSQNLVASAVLGFPALWRLHKKLDRHHREAMVSRETTGGVPC